MTTLKQRRKFLKQAFYLGSGVALLTSPFARAFADNSSGDYKALVCVDFGGGNDGTNMVVPYDISDAEPTTIITSTGEAIQHDRYSYDSYNELRESIGITKSDLLPISPEGLGHNSYGLHPSLSTVQALFNNQQAAVIANVGPLRAPNSAPPLVGSHVNQSELWQGLNPTAMNSESSGWMGRLAEQFNVHNSLHTSVSGKSLWHNGVEDYVAFIMGNNGLVNFPKIEREDANLNKAINSLMNEAEASNENAFMAEYARLDRAAQRKTSAVATAMNATDSLSILMERYAFPNTKLGQRFAVVLRTMLAREALGASRQSFYIKRGGFDFHAGMPSRQASLLKEFDDALAAFQNALNSEGLVDNVTTFTTSEFGRTTLHNNSGTGHGWGSHHFVVGGAVKGGKFYGNMPQMWPREQIASSPDMADTRGALFPSTAVDQYAATLVDWFTNGTIDAHSIFPNLYQFPQDKQNLGFMV